MKEIATNLYLGTTDEIVKAIEDGFKVVNVSSKYHYQCHNWEKGNNYQDNKCYLTHKGEEIFSVNWVDGAAKYFDWRGKGVETFKEILTFIENNLPTNKVLITCDQGHSRSPSIGLLYLSKVLHAIPDTSLGDADEEFQKIYPEYKPSQGIFEFLVEHWEEI